MKKLFALFVLLAIISGAVYAGDNQSAKYIRLLSRNAATDSIDSAYFNPAGTAFLEKGFHIQLNGQTVYLHYSHELSSTTYNMRTWVPFVPAAYLGYSSDNWTVFAGYSIPRGGGTVKWDSAKTYFKAPVLGDTDVSFGFEGSSSVHMLSVGGSYAFAFSPLIAVGVRFDIPFASEKYEANATLRGLFSTHGGKANLALSGTGFGGALGVHIQVNEAINASLTIESSQKIKLKEKSSGGATVTSSILKGSASDNADAPWVIRAGFSYAFSSGLEMPISLKYSFWKALDKKNKRDEIIAAIGFRYWLTEQLELSLGGSYANSNTPKDKLDGTFLDPSLGNFTIGGGIGWEAFDNFNLDVGLLYPIYFQADGKTYKKLKKQVIDIGIGIGYVF